MFRNWRPPSAGLWTLLFIGSISGLIDIPGATFMEMAREWQWLCITAFASLKAGVLWGLTPFFARRKWTAMLWNILIAIYLLLAFINGLSFLIFGLGISHKMVNLVLQTNPREASEAIGVFFSQIAILLHKTSAWIVILAVAGLWYILRTLPKRWLTYFVILTGTAGLIPLISLIPSLEVGKNSFFVSIRTFKDVYETLSTERQFQEIMSRRDNLPVIESVSSRHLANNVVMVIGESASRDCLSMYGFPLPTSPRLDAMSDSLMIFTDAVSPALFTSQVLESLLSFKSDTPDQKDWFYYPLLYDVMIHAGYQSWWLSNQERTGKFSNSSAAMVSNANTITYLSGDNGEDHLLRRYDEDIIPIFQQAMNDSSRYKFIGLQLMGSHLKYSLRYPASRNKFTCDDVLSSANKPWMTREKAQELASYANSLAYTDSILCEMINSVASTSCPAVLIYLSDHGEDVWWNHDWVKRDDTSARVPCIIYANKAYRENNQELISAVKSAVHRPFSTATLPDIILSLTGTTYDAYAGIRNPISSDFKPYQRYVDGEPYPPISSSTDRTESYDSRAH